MLIFLFLRCSSKVDLQSIFKGWTYINDELEQKIPDLGSFADFQRLGSSSLESVSTYSLISKVYKYYLSLENTITESHKKHSTLNS